MKKRNRVMRTLYDSMEYIDIGSDLKVRLLGFDLAGFKAFQELTYIPINPITVLAGLNSRGKSSVIQALLLLKQTLLAEKRVGGRITLDWDGSFFQVNRIEEMIYNRNGHGTFSFGFLSYCKTDKQYPTTVLGIISSDLNQFFVKTTFTFHYNMKLPDESGLRLEISFEVIDEAKNRLLTVKVTEVADSDNVRIEFYFDKEDEMDRVFPSTQIQYSYFMPMWNSSIPKFDASSQEFEVFRYSSVYHGLFHPILKAIQTELVNNLKYVGPLREEPQRSYINRRIRGDDIGARGENAVLLLQREWHETITFVKLPTTQSTDTGGLKVINWADLESQEMALNEAINNCLRWLGMQQLRVEEEGSSSIQATFSTLSTDDLWVTIADVGFGVSQILPVLTTGLLADSDSILIFEQPEIHLHPRAQARLAELLVCFARTGKRVLIETHSDHLINRLRRIIAEDMTDELSDKVSIAFVQHGEEGASVEALRVNEEGLVENWPDGFLAETADDAEAIMLAGMNKWEARQQSDEAQAA